MLLEIAGGRPRETQNEHLRLHLHHRVPVARLMHRVHHGLDVDAFLEARHFLAAGPPKLGQEALQEGQERTDPEVVAGVEGRRGGQVERFERGAAASAEQLGSLLQAVQPVYDELRRDPATRTFVDEQARTRPGPAGRVARVRGHGPARGRREDPNRWRIQGDEQHQARLRSRSDAGAGELRRAIAGGPRNQPGGLHAGLRDLPRQG